MYGAIPIGYPAYGYLVSLATELIKTEHLSKWRHSGLGILQFTTERYRLHIWDKRLRTPGIEWAGLVHSHLFEMASYVLVGSLRQQTWIAESWKDGSHALFERKGSGMVKLKACEAFKAGCYDVKAGYLYYQPIGEIHSTEPHELTVTHFTWPIGQEVKRGVTVGLNRDSIIQPVSHIGDELKYQVITEAWCKLAEVP